MLTSLTLEDFKSFRSSQLELSRLTLLVGANASGKSNVFDAIRFLQGLSLGMHVEEVLRGRSEGGREIWPGIRGGANEVIRHGANDFMLRSQWRLDGLTHRYEMSWFPYSEVCLVESFERDGAPPLHEDKESLGWEDGLLSLSGVDFDEDDRQLSTAIGRTREAMRGAFFLDINPRRMRDYVPKSSTRIGTQGENVSAAVWHLCQDETRKQDLLDWMSELCAPELLDLEFVDTGLGDVMLVLVEKDGARISARSLSDGTLRFLGELTALLTAPAGSLVLVEEIENGLHPARVHLLVELLSGLTAERGIQILATTHSPQVLRSLVDADPELARSALVFGRVPDEPGTIARRLGDLPHFDDVMERRGIEHLFTTQWLERAL